MQMIFHELGCIDEGLKGGLFHFLTFLFELILLDLLRPQFTQLLAFQVKFFPGLQSLVLIEILLIQLVFLVVFKFFRRVPVLLIRFGLLMDARVLLLSLFFLRRGSIVVDMMDIFLDKILAIYHAHTRAIKWVDSLLPVDPRAIFWRFIFSLIAQVVRSRIFIGILKIVLES